MIKLEEGKNFAPYRRELRRDGNIPLEVLLRRFFREVQQSKILSEMKKRRYHSKDVSRTEKREVARRKARIKKIKRGY